MEWRVSFVEALAGLDLQLLQHIKAPLFTGLQFPFQAVNVLLHFSHLAVIVFPLRIVLDGLKLSSGAESPRGECGEDAVLIFRKFKADGGLLKVLGPCWFLDRTGLSRQLHETLASGNHFNLDLVVRSLIVEIKGPREILELVIYHSHLRLILT